MFENTPIAYQTLDADGNILQVNTAWENMLGYAKKDVIGRSFSEFLLPEMRDRYKKQFPKKRSLDEILGPEFILLKENGVQILAAHRGKTRRDSLVESEVGRGSTFTILLPEFQGKVEEKSAEVVSLPKGNEKILFVDDEASIVKITQARHTALGYRVTCTTDPRKALDKVKADPSAFDLVITDMAMPHMAGDVLSSEILSLRPDLPIILCTGYSDVINEEKARGIGIADFLMKPAEMADFAVTVRKTLDKGK